jgi:hypothetical protein
MDAEATFRERHGLLLIILGLLALAAAAAPGAAERLQSMLAVLP